MGGDGGFAEFNDVNLRVHRRNGVWNPVGVWDFAYWVCPDATPAVGRAQGAGGREGAGADLVEEFAFPSAAEDALRESTR